MLSSLFRRRTLQPGFVFGVVFVLLVICTVAGYQYAIRLEQARIASEFQQLAAFKVQRVLLRVDGYARTLLDLRGLFVADPNVTNDAFQRFLNGIGVAERYPALLRIGYAPRVTPANRDLLANRLRRLGLINYHALPDDLPTMYSFPAVASMLGMDLGQNHRRREALDTARDINQPLLFRELRLNLSGDNGSGFVIYVPLYGYSTAPATMEERRRKLSGYLFAAFRTKDLIASTIDDDLENNMSLVLYDGPQPGAGQPPYDSRSEFQAPAHAAAARFASIQRANVCGRQWTFVFFARPAFVLANQSDLPQVVLAGGLLTSLLGALLAHVGMRRWLAERKIRYLAFHDELTGLPNRAKLRIVSEEAIRRERETGRPCALLAVELTRFREINYTLGHQIGEEVLKQASMRIRDAVNEDALVAWICNIQFGILLPDANQGMAIEVARIVVAAMEEPLPARESNYEVGARAGIAAIPGHGNDPDDLLRHADIALNQARTTGAEYAVYDPALDPYKPQRLALLGEFRQAIRDDQLTLYCQPKADLRTGRITSVEALVRWQHPEYGLLLPDQFIALIEPTELIQLLTHRMLESSLRQAHEWRKEDLSLPLAVNLSARNLLDPGLPDQIGGLMEDWGADASWVGLELTESSIMHDPVTSLRVLKRLHSMGLELFVDDFGTGYSSLSYLMKLPVAVIKIDQSFIMNMMNDADAAAIVKTIIELGHNMGLRVVAEGTASKEIWDALKRLNCDEAQGHYISPPFPAHTFRAWLERSPWRLAA